MQNLKCCKDTSIDKRSNNANPHGLLLDIQMSIDQKFIELSSKIVHSINTNKTLLERRFLYQLL